MASLGVSFVPGLNSYMVLNDPEASTASKVLAVGSDVLAVVGAEGVIAAVKTGSTLVRGAAVGTEVAGTAMREGVTFTEGSFSIIDWSNYPTGIPKPNGPFVLLQGEEYASARVAADRANKSLHVKDPLTYAGKDLHEIHPVKFGGSPTDLANKLPMSPSEHRKLTTWWNHLRDSVQAR